MENKLFEILERLTHAFEHNNQLLEKLIDEREPQSNILPLSEAWKVLGYSSYRTCYRKVADGHYRVGKEVIDRRSPDSQVPSYYLDIEACRARDKVSPAKRSA